MRWVRRVSMVACGAVLAGLLAQVPALAAGPSSAGSAAVPAHSAASGRQSASPATGPSRLPDPAGVLPSGWQRSADVAVTVSGDATGLHVLAAPESSGYAWRTVATLGDPAVQTNLWIGQACVTAGGSYAVVVYAPEQADNMAQQQGVLGRAAIVNLRTGAVKDLGGGFSIAYFDPGCGTGSTAVLTRGGWANDHSNAAMTTTLVVADAATGKVSAPVAVAGQVSSAVPYGGQIAAAGGRGVEEITTSGKARLLAATAAVPFRLTPATDGSLGYQVIAPTAPRKAAGTQVGLWQLAGGHARQVATAATGSVELSQVGGRTRLVGPQASKVAGLPRQWQPVDAPATAQPSTLGTVAVTSAGSAAPVKGQHYDPATAQPVAVGVQLLAGKGGTASFTVPAGAAPVAAVAGTAGSAAPVRRAGMTPAAAGSPSTPVSADRTCAVAIDDPTIQAYQPNFKQVEWAADQAVQGTLTTSRPANVYGNSLPSAYTPQGSNGLFPLPLLDGTGPMPPQVLLGVLTQESNLQQASVHVIQGQTSNPLTSFNWYGNWTNGETTNTGLINWSNSDCGYGIGQITSGMCLTTAQNGADQCSTQGTSVNPGLTTEQQLAVAVDYQANIAAAASMLVSDWNTLSNLGILPIGPGIPAGGTYSQYVGEWYMTAWMYNSGLEPGTAKYGNTNGCQPDWNVCTDNGNAPGNWGLGYADNPINPIYPPDRPVFPSASSSTTPTGTTYTVNWDMSHPQYWPYQEKVISWAFDSITLYDYSQGKSVQAFAWAHGSATGAYPPNSHFCFTPTGLDPATPGNNCNASVVNTSSGSTSGPDACQLANDHCWWHYPNGYATTTPTSSCTNCGQGVITYAAGAADPGPEPIAAQFAQTCASTLPTTAVIVWEGGKSALGCPGQNWTSQGSFTWNFAPDSNGRYSSKIDFDQIGAGFGGHFWFGYSQAATPTDTVITGTWNPPTSVSGWADVKVAIPSYGANASGAMYVVNPGGGQPGKNVIINQGVVSGANTWVDLGTFHLGSGATVSLSNVTPDYFNTGSVTSGDLAWSAAAFIPVSGPPWVYTAMGDSYSSGEGNPPYDVGTDASGGCHRSNAAFGRQFADNTAGIGYTGIQHIACSGAKIANLTNTGQNGEQPQIAQITPNAQLVTVTIGGNDAGFAGILTSCITTTTNCESTYNGTGSSNEYTIIDGLQSQLVTAYKDMQAQAPNAKIVAVTYPNIFKPFTACQNINATDVEFLINLTFYLDNTIIAAAKQAGINVLDERYAFLGHELCSSQPWVYGLTTGQNSVLDFSPSFHPTATGQLAMSQDLGKYWTALQAGGAPTVYPVGATAPATGWLPRNLPYGIPTTAQATTMLNSLPNISAYADGYNPNASYWSFRTRNNCNVRDTVLRAQALTAQQSPPVALAGTGSAPCPVTQGSWELPYDWNVMSPTTPQISSVLSNIQIDHIVPKANAWETGAQDWPVLYPNGTQMLIDFTNDLGGPELLAVSQGSNGSKQDSPPQDWMPSTWGNKGMDCTYAKMWIAVKWEWALEIGTVNDGINGTEPTERIFLTNTLNSC